MKLAVLISVIFLAACMQGNNSKPTEVKPPADNQVMCTMDARQCADGSWVGRNGADCEFVCPAATDK